MFVYSCNPSAWKGEAEDGCKFKLQVGYDCTAKPSLRKEKNKIRVVKLSQQMGVLATKPD